MGHGQDPPGRRRGSHARLPRRLSFCAVAPKLPLAGAELRTAEAGPGTGLPRTRARQASGGADAGARGRALRSASSTVIAATAEATVRLQKAMR